VQQGGSFINALLSFSLQELKWSSEPDGDRKATLDIAAATFDENGLALSTVNTTFALQLNSQKYAEALQKGMVYGIHVPIDKPGPYLMRAALRDPATESLGAAEQFIEVPDVANGHLALSGIVLQEAAAMAADAKAAPPTGPAPREDFTGGAARRRFRRGETVVYSYEIINAKAGAGQHLELEVQTRLFREGEQVLADQSTPSTGNVSDPQRLSAGGRMTLGRNLAVGKYVLQLAVTDKLAPSKFKTVSQSVDFDIEP
jgi:hypothetical protein